MLPAVTNRVLPDDVMSTELLFSFRQLLKCSFLQNHFLDYFLLQFSSNMYLMDLVVVFSTWVTKKSTLID